MLRRCCAEYKINDKSFTLHHQSQRYDKCFHLSMWLCYKVTCLFNILRHLISNYRYINIDFGPCRILYSYHISYDLYDLQANLNTSKFIVNITHSLIHCHCKDLFKVIVIKLISSRKLKPQMIINVIEFFHAIILPWER